MSQSETVDALRRQMKSYSLTNEQEATRVFYIAIEVYYDFLPAYNN